MTKRSVFNGQNALLHFAKKCFCMIPKFKGLLAILGLAGT
jgi:hypothetical protein